VLRSAPRTPPCRPPPPPCQALAVTPLPPSASMPIADPLSAVTNAYTDLGKVALLFGTLMGQQPLQGHALETTWATWLDGGDEVRLAAGGAALAWAADCADDLATHTVLPAATLLACLLPNSTELRASRAPLPAAAPTRPQGVPRSPDQWREWQWLWGWHRLGPEAQRAKASEHCCYELAFFLALRDPPFFSKASRLGLREGGRGWGRVPQRAVAAPAALRSRLTATTTCDNRTRSLCCRCCARACPAPTRASPSGCCWPATGACPASSPAPAPPAGSTRPRARPLRSGGARRRGTPGSTRWRR
jgi:hypothetical protein